MVTELAVRGISGKADLKFLSILCIILWQQSII